MFNLSFHHLLNIFLFPLQIYVFYKCMFYHVLLQLLLLPSAISFVCCQIHFGKFFFFFFGTMDVVPVKEVRLVVEVNDLDFKIRDVAFEAKVVNRYGTFDRITIGAWKIHVMHICIVICWTI